MKQIKLAVIALFTFATVGTINAQDSDNPWAVGFGVNAVDVRIPTEFSDYAKSNIKKENLTPKIIIDAEMNLSDISMRFLKFLNALEPFGPKNIRPVFATNNIRIVGNPKVIGKNRDTIKFIVRKNKTTFEAIGFGLIESFEDLLKNKPIDIAYSIGENEWQGEKTVQLEIKDIKIAEI